MHTLLAALVEAEPKKGLLRSAFGLWAITSVVAAVLILVLAVTIANRRARRATGGSGRKRRRRAIPDAWAEAGRRVEPIRMDEPEPPTAEEPEDDRP